MKHWTITNAAGDFLGQIQLATGVHPSDIAASGWDWKDDHIAVQHTSAADPAVKSFKGGKWADDPHKINTALAVQVDRDREQAAMAVLSRGTGKTLEYMHKQREVLEYRALPAGQTKNLELGERRARFPFAMAEVDMTSDSLETVIKRFEAGIAASIPDLAKVAAKAQVAKRAVKAAGSKAAKQSAADVDWTI